MFKSLALATAAIGVLFLSACGEIRSTEPLRKISPAKAPPTEMISQYVQGSENYNPNEPAPTQVDVQPQVQAVPQPQPQQVQVQLVQQVEVQQPATVVVVDPSSQASFEAIFTGQPEFFMDGRTQASAQICKDQLAGFYLGEGAVFTPNAGLNSEITTKWRTCVATRSDG